MGKYTPEDGIPYDMQQQLAEAMDVMRDATDTLAIAVSNIEEHAPIPMDQFDDYPRASQLLQAVRQVRK